MSKLAANEEPSLGTRDVKNVKRKAPATVVDDRFFRLSEMEQFLEKEERDEPVGSDTDDEEIDYFAEVDEEDDDGADNAMFKDFFDGPEQEEEIEDEDDDEQSDGSDMDIRDVDDLPVDKNTDVLSKLMEASDSDEESGPKTKSSFEKEQEIESAKMRKLEQQNLESKPWQLQGEASATARPTNSLLEEYLPFDAVSRDPPTVTVETSEKLEQILKLRISNASWDDVERKIKPEKQPFEFRRRLELEQNKSKLSLAQVYEKEFNDKKKADEPFVEEKSAAQIEVEQMSRSVLLKLSALSSFHFTPRLPEPSVQMINNLPAITVEEAIPEATSSVTLVAPQEIAAPEKRVTKGKSEREDVDKKRERRFKKKFQANKFKLQGMKAKISDKKMPEHTSGQSVKSSRFFSELQKKVTSSNATKLGPKKQFIDVKKLKL